MDTKKEAKDAHLKQIFETDPLLGKLLKDKITGFEGIAVTKLVCLFGCDQYGLCPQDWNKEKGKRPDTEYFDEARLEVTGEGVRPGDVQSSTPGGDMRNHDAPR
jgi:hypothetical protein